MGERRRWEAIDDVHFINAYCGKWLFRQISCDRGFVSNDFEIVYIEDGMRRERQAHGVHHLHFNRYFKVWPYRSENGI